MTKKLPLEKKIDQLVNDLLVQLNITASVDIQEVPSEDPSQKTFHIALSPTTESGLLIGAHGATLNALQSFIALSLKQQTGEWVRINLDVGQWRQRHEEYLTELAKQAAERARLTHEPQHLYNLKPSQRRIVHLSLSQEKDIATESLGEGENRYLVVKPL